MHLNLTNCFNSRAHEGRDIRGLSISHRGKEFQFTRPRGARQYLARVGGGYQRFQFTRPRGARQYVCLSLFLLRGSRLFLRTRSFLIRVIVFLPQKFHNSLILCLCEYPAEFGALGVRKSKFFSTRAKSLTTHNANVAPISRKKQIRHRKLQGNKTGARKNQFQINLPNDISISQTA